MAMSHKGLTKLIEEAGEVVQVAAKAQALGHLGQHWDGTILKDRLEDEIGDVMAACHFNISTHDLNFRRIMARCREKLATFDAWHRDPEN